MYAKITDGAISTGTLKQLFPNTSFPAGVADSDFKTANGLQDIVNAERKDDKYYWVTQGDITLVDGVATRGFSNVARRIEDVAEVDHVSGDPIYVQEWDADFDNGEGKEPGKMVDTSEQLVTRGLKHTMKAQIKSQANSALADTDWMVIRKAERSVAIPSATVTYRAGVVKECARLETAIAGAADVDALQAVMQAQNWPETV